MSGTYIYRTCTTRRADQQAEPTYIDILEAGDGVWDYFDPDIEAIRDLCAAECDWISDAARSLKGRLTKLRTISSGAFLGGQPEFWKEIYLHQNPHLIDPARIDSARYAISELVVNPHVVHACQRVEFGPLVFGPGIWTNKDTLNKPDGPQSVHFTSHITNEPVDTPAIFGGVSKWYCPFQNLNNEEDIKRLIKFIVNTQSCQSKNRKLSVDQYKLENPAGAIFGPFLSTDIYMSEIMFRPEVLEFVQNSLRENAKHCNRMGNVPSIRTSGDAWRLKRLKDAPPCSACGWAASKADIGESHRHWGTP